MKRLAQGKAKTPCRHWSTWSIGRPSAGEQSGTGSGSSRCSQFGRVKACSSVAAISIG